MDLEAVLDEEYGGLNPYFNGIYFLIDKVREHHNEGVSLNPYFNGIYFLIPYKIMETRQYFNVLILILMEYTFWFDTSN